MIAVTSLDGLVRAGSGRRELALAAGNRTGW
jgi:hypothetical protein